MKDAKGHGSAAHQEGVQQATQPEYQWMKQGGAHYLIPSTDAGVANAIARVEKRSDLSGIRGDPSFKATLLRGFNEGHARAGNWALHKNVQGGKSWIKSITSNSWTPPNIR